MRISDLSSEVCSSDLSTASSRGAPPQPWGATAGHPRESGKYRPRERETVRMWITEPLYGASTGTNRQPPPLAKASYHREKTGRRSRRPPWLPQWPHPRRGQERSEEHTSELQSLMRISYAVFCLKQKKKTKKH